MWTYETYVNAPDQAPDTGRRIDVFGPPGTGKTTYLGRQITRGAKQFGSDGVLVASFTKAAATELANRNLPLAKGSVGTLHSHCYRALGAPVIAETQVADWNRQHPGYRLTITANDVEEPDPELAIRSFGDDLYARQQILRAKMEPEQNWPKPVGRFHSEWTDWKRAGGLLDFTDLIETGIRELKIAPGNPRLLVVDEAQDLSRLQLSLVEQWGRHTDYTLIAADDDQTIFSFAGAAPEVLLEGSDEAYFSHVLSQSYRVPRTVHELSQAWIQKVSLRKAKEYKPRDAEGEIQRFYRGNYRNPDPVVRHAEQYLKLGKTVMFLGSCSYMLEPLKRVLRQRGLPFHNPYRPKRIDWNPLAPLKRGTSPAERVLAFLKPRDEAGGHRWTGEDMRLWTAWVRSNSILRDSAAEIIERMAPDFDVYQELLHDVLEPHALLAFSELVCGDSVEAYIKWWLRHMPAKKKRLAEYPAKVATQYGVHALTEQPRIVIGTGHSVKGGEADVVYIFPDLSASGMRQWSGHRHERDALIRLGYVMMTRARETLVLCDPAGSSSMPIAALAARLASDRRDIRNSVL